MVTFNVNVGDAIHRCYFEIELPIIEVSDEPSEAESENEVVQKKSRIDRYPLFNIPVIDGS